MKELTQEEIWLIATKINESDGLMPSNYLKELIEENKKNKLTTEEIIKRLKSYYEERD